MDAGHLEVDIAGAFSEIVRRIDLRGDSATGERLPHSAQMRTMLERELSTQQPCSHVMPTVKKVLHIAMNAPVNTALQYLAKQSLQPTHPVAKALYSLRQITQQVCQALYSDKSTCRKHSLPHNCNFFHLEAIEADCISSPLAGLLRLIPQASIILLHDGLLIAPPPSASLLSTLHHQALTTAGLEDDGTPFLNVVPLESQYNELVTTLHPPSQAQRAQLRAFEKALLSAKRAYRKLADHTNPRHLRTANAQETTHATLESFFQRVGNRKRND